jgi:hypothetical protein
VELAGATFTLRFTSRFFADKIQNKPRGRAIFEEIIDKTLGASPGTYHIKCALAGENGAARSSAPIAVAAPVEPPAEHSQLLDEAIAVFGGQIVE